MRDRLLLGPALVLLMLGGFWLDERIDAAVVPQPLRVLLGDRETFPPGVIVFLVCVAASVMAVRELSAILREKGVSASRRVMTVSGLAGLFTSSFIPVNTPGVQSVALVGTAAMVVLTGSLVFYARKRTVEGVVAAAGGSLLAFVYLGLMFGFVLAIRREHSAWVLAWVILTIKSSDIGAYFAGRAFGSRKLIPWLSPGKTQEGLLGGVLFAAGIGALGAWALSSLALTERLSWERGLVAGALLALVGQLGDLMASLFKRDAGIKDSGRALPGFGGLLDILDSPLLAAPLAFWLLWAWEPVVLPPAG